MRSSPPRTLDVTSCTTTRYKARKISTRAHTHAHKHTHQHTHTLTRTRARTHTQDLLSLVFLHSASASDEVASLAQEILAQLLDRAVADLRANISPFRIPAVLGVLYAQCRSSQETRWSTATAWLLALVRLRGQELMPEHGATILAEVMRIMPRVLQPAPQCALFASVEEVVLALQEAVERFLESGAKFSRKNQECLLHVAVWALKLDTGSAPISACFTGLTPDLRLRPSEVGSAGAGGGWSRGDAGGSQQGEGKMEQGRGSALGAESRFRWMAMRCLHCVVHYHAAFDLLAVEEGLVAGIVRVLDDQEPVAEQCLKVLSALFVQAADPGRHVLLLRQILSFFNEDHRRITRRAQQTVCMVCESMGAEQAYTALARQLRAGGAYPLRFVQRMTSCLNLMLLLDANLYTLRARLPRHPHSAACLAAWRNDPSRTRGDEGCGGGRAVMVGVGGDATDKMGAHVPAMQGEGGGGTEGRASGQGNCRGTAGEGDGEVVLGEDLFHTLFATWCCSAVAPIILCLFCQAYDLCELLVEELVRILQGCDKGQGGSGQGAETHQEASTQAVLGKSIGWEDGADDGAYTQAVERKVAIAEQLLRFFPQLHLPVWASLRADLLAPACFPSLRRLMRNLVMVLPQTEVVRSVARLLRRADEDVMGALEPFLHQGSPRRLVGGMYSRTGIGNLLLQYQHAVDTCRGQAEKENEHSYPVLR